MIKSSIYIALLCFTVFFSCKNGHPPKKKIVKDNFNEKCRKLVLSENKIGQEYIFKITKKEIDELHISYLGTIKTNKGDTLKFVNFVNYFGIYEDSKNGNGSIYIYDKQNSMIGYYYVGPVWGVPIKIEGSSLIFSFNNDFCNKTTSISFFDSIPKEIFINCTDKGGDLYNLIIN